MFGFVLVAAAFSVTPQEIETVVVDVPVMLGISSIAEISAYTASEDETDSRPWEMASGKTIYDGAIACPSRLTFGTQVLVEDRLYTCEDRMSRRYRDGNHFDILVGTKEEARVFGRKSLETIVIQ